MNRLIVQEGYSMPFSEFDGYKRRRKRKASARRGGRRAQQNKMKVCAVKWRRSGKKGSYRSFMKRCLK